MEAKKQMIKFSRCDGVVTPGLDYSNSIVKEYVHKQVVKHLSDNEDDWIIEEKPVCISEHDVFKEIQVEASKNNLKALIAQVMRTGDESLLNQQNKVFGDFSNVPEDIISAKKMADKSKKVIDHLPDSLKGKSMDELLNMSNEELLKAYGVKVEKKEVKKSEDLLTKPVESQPVEVKED